MVEENPLTGKSLLINGQRVAFDSEQAQNLEYGKEVKDGLKFTAKDKQGVDHTLTLTVEKEDPGDKNRLWFDIEDESGEKILYYSIRLRRGGVAYINYKSHYNLDDYTFQGIKLSSAVLTLIAKYLKEKGVKKIKGVIPEENEASIKTRVATTNLKGEKLEHQINRKPIAKFLNRITKRFGKFGKLLELDTSITSVTTKLKNL